MESRVSKVKDVVIDIALLFGLAAIVTYVLPGNSFFPF